MRFWFVLAGALALLGVALEAYGSHALRESLSPERWATFQTASRNHMYHALGLFAVSIAADRWPGRLVTAAGWLLVAGLLLFSGSLYLAAIAGRDELRALPGFGGTAWLAGWAALAAAALWPPAPRSHSQSDPTSEPAARQTPSGHPRGE